MHAIVVGFTVLIKDSFLVDIDADETNGVCVIEQTYSPQWEPTDTNAMADTLQITNRLEIQ